MSVVQNSTIVARPTGEVFAYCSDMFGVGTFANGELREAHNFSSCP